MSYAGQIETGDGSISPIGSTLYGVCSTAAAAVAKTVTLSDFDTLLTGVTIHVKFTYSNTAASPTLNVNSTGPIAIYAYGTSAPGNTAATSWAANSVVSLTYDGTYWRMNDVGANEAIITNAHNEVTVEATARATAVTGVANQLAAPYDSTATYALGDMCIYNDALYECTTAITTAEAWTAAHWTATTVKAQIGTTIKATDVTAGVDSTAETTVSGTGITAASVTKSTFESQITTTGSYVFSYDGADWKLSGNTVLLATYGIEVTGTVVSGDSVTVAYTAGTSPFESNNLYAADGYPFRAVIPISGVTSSMKPEVVFGMADAVSGNFAPVAETYNGGVYIYSAMKPTASITIPVIECRG